MAKSTKKSNKDKKPNINKILILSVLLISFAVLLIQRLTSTKGDIAVVDFSESNVVYEISLDKDSTYTFDDGNYPIFLEVKDHAIRFYDSQCPDHLCEDFGFISQVNNYAVCMPAGAAVVIY